jgi:eukaryotic-like serine/threonine-protein kinase
MGGDDEGVIGSDPEGEDPPAAPSGFVEPGQITALLRELVSAADLPVDIGWTGVLRPGSVVGRFELVKEIGRGGFGVVWEATDRGLHRSVAFKAVLAGVKAAAREERLQVEAEAAARMSHPNLVTLYDVGRTEHGAYLVYELLKGETLSRRLSRGSLPEPEALRIAIEIARGVAHAHARGVLHRDLKPANVMLCSDGPVKILDFGLAHAFGWQLASGGTPAYMAPEQEAGANEDERTDVYAMGAILRRMLTGNAGGLAPGQARTQSSPGIMKPASVPDTGQVKLAGEEARAPLAAPGSGKVLALANRMMEHDPDRRPRNGAEVLAELSRVAEELARAAQARASSRYRRRVVAGVAAALVASASLAGMVTHYLTAPATDRRPVVAVADFANETDDPDLDGLSGLLITSMEQSRSLRVLTRGRMLDLLRELGKGDVLRVDETLAREVGRRAHVRALLLASIRRLGDTYAAEMRAIDPLQDEYLFTLSDGATTKEEILLLIGRMSERARLALREPDAEIRSSEVALAAAVTPSLQAYRHYFQGKDLATRGRLEDAVGEYQQAIAIAPRFAMAKLEIAWAGYLSGLRTPSAAREILSEGSRDAERAPEKEARLFRTLEAFFAGRFAESSKELRALATRYPDDRDVATLTAAVLFLAGDEEGALPFFERTLQLAPDSDLMRVQQIELLCAAGKLGESRALAEAGARQRGTAMARAAVALSRYCAGDVEGGIAMSREPGNEPQARMLLAHGLAKQGKSPEALDALAPIESSLADNTGAQVLASAGRLREGAALLDRAARSPGADVGFGRQVTAWYLSAAGDLAGARRMVEQGEFFTALDGIMLATIGDERRLASLLAEMDPGSTQAGLLRALTTFRRGDRSSALSALRGLDRGGASFVPYFHGLVAAESGLDAEAVEAFRRFERPVFVGSNAYQAPWLQARARYLAARSLHRLGRDDEARQLVELQLDRWKGADPELPLLADLKALQASLAASSQRP